MKKFNKLKIIQLIIFIVVAIIGIVIVFTDAELYQMIGFDPHIRILCIVLWIVLGLSFIFMFLDYRLDSQLRRENEELNYAFYTDPNTGIANRNSCDAYIHQFQNGLLPDGKDRNRSVGRHGHSLDRQIAPCFECFIIGFVPPGALLLGEDVLNRHSSIARA